MKFSFLTYLFSRYPLEYCFKMAQEYGFEGVEIWGARPHAYAWDMTNKKIEEILSWSEQHGISISMYTPEILAYPYNLVSSDYIERQETIEYLKKSLEVASALETDKMQITIKHPGYGRNRKEIWKFMSEGLKELCDKAENVGVDIILESLSPSEGNVITCVDDIVQIKDMVDSARLCSMIDMVPPFIANEPYAEYFHKLGNSMKYVHICNSDGKTEFHMQIDDPKGEIPLTDFFKVLQNNGYDGWYSIELLAPYFKDPELYLAQAGRILQTIKGQLKK